MSGSALTYDTGLREVDYVGPGGLADSIDPQAGGGYRDKPIITATQAGAVLHRTGLDWTHNNYGVLDDSTLNFGFWSSIGQLRNSYYSNQDHTDFFTEAFNAADFSIFNPAQIGLAIKTIGLWDDLIAIDFKLTSADKADITYGNTFTGGAQAYAYLPFGDVDDSYYAQFGFQQTGRIGGDVWVDNTVASNFFPTDDGYYALTTLIHETGHALGLSHPGNYDALDPGESPTYANSADYAQDSLQYSIMSYFDGYETGAQYIDWSLENFAYPSTPQIHDIVAVQQIYGADMTTRTGDTTYGFNSTADRDVFDFTYNTRPIVTIWDAGGKDTLDFSGWNTPSVMDLHAGAFSSGGGIQNFLALDQINANRGAAGLPVRTAAQDQFYQDLKAQLGLTNGLYKDNVAIAYGATIENAVGGGGDDLIRPNEVANVINGGLGNDTVSYDKAAAGVITSLLGGGSGGEAAGDSYISIENLSGSAFADTLSGDNGANVLQGNNGDDRIDGRGGNDRIDGGEGRDRLSGNDGNDVLRGNAGNDRLDGGKGDDALFGGNGDDVLIGGTGMDTMTGGTGADRFVFNPGDGSRGRSANIITDFLSGTDKIDLTAIHDVGGSYSILRSTTTQAFIGVDGNGDGKLDFDIHLTLIGGALTTSDILFL